MKIHCKLMMLALFIASPTLFAETGLAFVHGTRNHPDAINDYWTPAFVHSITQGIEDPDNYVVANCDFSQYMWDPAAAGCLAETLERFISTKNIDNLIVITHSHGGNMMRWILSNPTWDTRYPKIINTISRVIAIAPSSAGTPLADAVMQGYTLESHAANLLGYVNDAVQQQQISWMENYNNTWLNGTAGRPSLAKPFEVIVGSNVIEYSWDENSYCGGYEWQVGLKFTQLWLDSCSDGVLDCSSQRAAGTVWFVDQEKTGGKFLSHHQSRRECFNLDTLIRQAL